MALTRFKIIIILFSIWILAIVLPAVRFAPGNWTLLQLERIQEHGSPGMQVFLEVIGICLIVSMAILGILAVISIGRRRRKKQEDDYFIYKENPPVTWVVYVVIVLLFAGLGGIIWLSWRHADVFEDLMGPKRSLERRVEGQHPPAPKPSTPETTRPEIHTVSSPKWRVPLILALLVLLGLSIRYIFKSKPLQEGLEAPQVVQIVANAVKELERGGELSDTVLRCYRDMCRILGRKVAMSRDLTAREITQLLLQTGIREREVTRLTDLFERVRYGRFVTGASEQAEALALLKAIEEKYGRSSNET